MDTATASLGNTLRHSSTVTTVTTTSFGFANAPAMLNEVYAKNFSYSTNGSWFQNRTEFGNESMYNLEGCEALKKDLAFDQIQVVRVTITWLLFFISAMGNVFVLSCVYRKAKSSHVHLIMLHFTLADLAYTFMVMPNDAIWNTTMEWTVGEFLCRTCQMFKQMGMYISSFMVVVVAVDRCCSILQPMSTPIRQRTRTKYLVGGAWILSILSAIPPAILFTVGEWPFCPDRPPFLQCVDFIVVNDTSQRRPYYFFTMFMSFILPMLFTAISYSLVVCEISNMMRRDRVMMGRRDSCNFITRARRKTLFMTSMVTLSFLLFWGPYYGLGIYDWFNQAQVPREVSTTLFLLMYIHPAIHPILYGVLMKDVRVKFGQLMSRLERIMTCNSTEAGYGEKTLNCLSMPRKAQSSIACGYSQADSHHETCRPTDNAIQPDIPTCFRTGGTGSDSRSSDLERKRLISANTDPDGDLGNCVQGTTPNPEALPMRCSTVTFDLTESESEAVWNNNNEKILESEEDVFKSTIV